MKKILIPIDFSFAAENAIRYVNEIFREQDVEVSLVYIRSEKKSLTDTELNGLYSELHTELLSKTRLVCDFFIEDGNLTDTVKKTIDTRSIDMVVVGTKGSLEDDIISNASQIVKEVTCPIIVVPENVQPGNIKKIAYANDFKDIKDSSVFKPLWSIARAFKAKVYVVHIHRGAELTDKEEDVIEYYLDNIDHEYVYISNENIEIALNDFILEKEVDLLVILPRNHGRNDLNAKGELLNNISNKTRVPVLALA